MAHVFKKTVKSKGGTTRDVWGARWKNEKGRWKEKATFTKKKDAQKFLTTVGPEAARDFDLYGSEKTYIDVAREYRLSLTEPTDGSDPIGEQTSRTYRHYLTYSAFVLQHHKIGEVDDRDMQNVRDHFRRTWTCHLSPRFLMVGIVCSL